MTTDMDAIKNKIKKLLAMAADDANLDGEVKTAMALAERAMEKYHLSHADIDAANVAANVTVDDDFQTQNSRGQNVRITQWERKLAVAIRVLMGSVGCFRDHVESKSGFGRVQQHGVITWYGTCEDVTLADDLFCEWAAVIGTIAMGKHNGVSRGAGARYALGFAESLLEQAETLAAKRREIITPSTTALTVAGETLSALLAQKRGNARNWLVKTKNVKLATGRSSGYAGCNGGHDAYNDGRADGQRADFNATRRHKLPGATG